MLPEGHRLGSGYFIIATSREKDHYAISFLVPQSVPLMLTIKCWTKYCNCAKITPASFTVKILFHYRLPTLCNANHFLPILHDYSDYNGLYKNVRLERH